MVRRTKKKCKINLALQGGGSYGAFTWGVLDRLLQEENIELDGFSGASSGALNAAVLATGYMKGGRSGAREALENFWMQVSSLAPGGSSLTGAFTKFVGNFFLQPAALVKSALLLNQFANINPLRSVIAKHVDCKAIARGISKFFVSATKLSTGRARIFQARELSVDVLLASACLPYFFKAIHIDGEYYWDGGYSSNPPLWPLIESAGVKDILLVQLNPSSRFSVPNNKPEVIDRTMEISFNSPLISELKSVAAAPESRLFLHRIIPQPEMQKLPPLSRLIPEKKLVLQLKALGNAAANIWLSTHVHQIGSKSSFQLDEV